MIAREHRASGTARYSKPPAEIFAMISNFSASTEWRTGLSKVELLPPQNGKPVVRETLSMGPITMVVEEVNSPSRMVTRIADDELPFGGTWTFEVEPDGSGSKLRITEDGFVKPAAFRFMAKFIFGYHATLEQYLKDLGKKFGEEVKPVRS